MIDKNNLNYKRTKNSVIKIKDVIRPMRYWTNLKCYGIYDPEARKRLGIR